jgi:starch phosphorylase
MEYRLSSSEARELIRQKLSHYFGVTPVEATNEHFYKAMVLIVKDMLQKGRNDFMERAEKQDAKQVYYLCMEFLMGRSLKNNLSNLGLMESMKQALADFDVKLDKIFDEEPDAGLGNGGLGRLAACYLDGLATDGYPAMGYSICYEYGIFRQRLVDGWQTELPDFWLPGGEVWFVDHPEQAIEVRFDGKIRDWWDGSFHHVDHEDYSSIKAIPHDLMVSGQDGKGVSVLRLFSAEAPGLDMKLFNEGQYMRAMEQNAMAKVISQVLYPADDHYEGKSLRLRQQYFLVSASVQDIVRNHLQKYGTLDNLPEKAAIHTNDTHPVLAIPELMRILLDECGYHWEKSWDIVSRTIAYTNHTVMKEALECWPVDLFKERLPRIYQIVTEIDNRHREQVWNASHDADLVERTAILSGGVVRMANMAVAACHSVNGVSQLHSEILKDSVFADFYRLTPSKFKNVTNGIAHRRWLNQANPELAGMITDLIGNDYIYDADKLQELL